jgi:hypothetical protein
MEELEPLARAWRFYHPPLPDPVPLPLLAAWLELAVDLLELALWLLAAWLELDPEPPEPPPPPSAQAERTTSERASRTRDEMRLVFMPGGYPEVSFPDRVLLCKSSECISQRAPNHSPICFKGDPVKNFHCLHPQGCGSSTSFGQWVRTTSCCGKTTVGARREGDPAPARWVEWLQP